MLVESVKCCGCGACADICPVNAIEMKPNEDGFLEPVINGETCKHCGRCDKVCPVMNIESLKTGRNLQIIPNPNFSCLNLIVIVNDLTNVFFNVF